MARPLRVLFFDIETTPAVTYSWRPDDPYHPHPMLLRESHLLTWAAKWRGQTKVFSDRLTPTEAEIGDPNRITQSLYEMIAEAEILVAHNIKRFDWPKFNGYILEQRLDPIPPPRIVDTVVWARQFGFPYKRLDYLSEKFGFGGKMDTDFDLWARCMQGDEQALRYMEKYNRKDVRDLEGVFNVMLPYVKGAPKLMVGTDPAKDEFGCTFCGSTNVQKRGFKDTNAARYQQVQCQECRKFSYYPTYDRRSRLLLRPA